jgi:hypothetical protein
MDERHHHDRRSGPAQSGHEFQTPTVRETPPEVRRSRAEPSTQPEPDSPKAGTEPTDGLRVAGDAASSGS